jgi:transglutaminase-like putative cysteine protease
MLEDWYNRAPSSRDLRQAAQRVQGEATMQTTYVTPAPPPATSTQAPPTSATPIRERRAA